MEKIDKWYVVQVRPGIEKKVKRTIEEGLENASLIDVVHEILMPTENVAEVKKGKQVVREKNLWPGYLIVKMDLTDDAWLYIKNANGVIDLLGGAKPTALTQSEVDEILSELKGKDGEVVHKYDMEAGDEVKITDGVFVNFTGSVIDVFRDKGRISVQVSIFGRETRVDDLEFWQVEKVIND
jgi:transcription termination/antitermination protein NusG